MTFITPILELVRKTLKLSLLLAQDTTTWKYLQLILEAELIIS